MLASLSFLNTFNYWWLKNFTSNNDDDDGSFSISEDQLWEGLARGGRHALKWLISPILDRQIPGHLGHKKVGPVGSCSCTSFHLLVLSSAASRLVISKSCAALLGLMPALVNQPFSCSSLLSKKNGGETSAWLPYWEDWFLLRIHC